MLFKLASNGQLVHQVLVLAESREEMLFDRSGATITMVDGHELVEIPLGRGGAGSGEVTVPMQGTIIKVLQIIRTPDETLKILVEGMARVKIDAVDDADDHLQVAVTPLEETLAEGTEVVRRLWPQQSDDDAAG